MSILLHGDCLEELKSVDDNSIDLIFCDLPYGQTSCKWDFCIDLDLFWIEMMRVKKLNTPLFFTTTTKFGVSLIQSAPKKCFFRYDLIWVKSAPAGFLSAKKMPMRKHEMIYVFYEKLPFYDLSSHTHKFIKSTPMGNKPDIYGRLWNKDGEPYIKDKIQNKYSPSLPVSVIKEELAEGQTLGDKGNECYGKFAYYNNGVKGYDPPLPVSVVKEETGGATGYDPPLPVSDVKEELDEKYKNKGGLYSKISRNGLLKAEPHYEPPLPVSVVKEDVYNSIERFENGKLTKHPRHLQKGDDPIYEPKLPTSMLEIKSTKGNHATEKPVALMEWILKYYSKEGDVVLDPTMGSGSTGIACKNMNRNFIGIEKDPEIYEAAVNRIED